MIFIAMFSIVFQGENGAPGVNGTNGVMVSKSIVRVWIVRLCVGLWWVRV